MAEPRPTFFEGNMLVVAHLFRGLSVLCLVVALLAFVIDLIAFARQSDFRFLAPLAGGIAALSAICGLFIWGSTAFIRALGRQVQQSGPW